MTSVALYTFSEPTLFVVFYTLDHLLRLTMAQSIRPNFQASLIYVENLGAVIHWFITDSCIDLPEYLAGLAWALAVTKNNRKSRRLLCKSSRVARSVSADSPYVHLFPTQVVYRPLGGWRETDVRQLNIWHDEIPPHSFTCTPHAFNVAVRIFIIRAPRVHPGWSIAFGSLVRSLPLNYKTVWPKTI